MLLVLATLWGASYSLIKAGVATIPVFVLFMVAFVLLTRSDPQPETIGWALAMLLLYLISMPARRVEV